MRFFKSLIFIVLLFLPASSYAQEKLPEYTGWVNDFAGVISPEYKARINSLIVELEAKTSAEIFVVTVQSIAPYSEFDYAQMLFDKWKIGKKGKDNGVLALLAVQERRWRIQTGYGVEGILPDSLCSQIGRNHMVPYFKTGKYDEGLYYGGAAIANVISKDAGISLNGLYGVDLKSRPQQPVPITMYFFAIFFFMFWNIPWPIFIGLPATILFGWGMAHSSPLLGVLVACGYISAMVIRYKIWSKLSPDTRKSFWFVLFWGLAGMSTGGGYRGSGFSGGGFGGGGFSGGGGFGGGGGGCSGGGGAGGGF